VLQIYQKQIALVPCRSLCARHSLGIVVGHSPPTFSTFDAFMSKASDRTPPMAVPRPSPSYLLFSIFLTPDARKQAATRRGCMMWKRDRKRPATQGRSRGRKPDGCDEIEILFEVRQRTDNL